MATLIRASSGSEATNDALNAIINKALAFPQVGSHIGGGVHVDMPQSWNGQGATPPGWTKQRQQVWIATALDSILPLPDPLAALLQGGPAQSRLTGPEIATLAQAIAGRVTVDLEAGYFPKASAAQAAKSDVREGPP